jgi:NAD(P)-dependent dehydrogenase (short-subunit alcohol dehydrogenase family)
MSKSDIFDLKGKVFIVAGGAGYLARPACRELLCSGAAVVIADYNQELLDEAAVELEVYADERLLCLQFDISDEASIDSVLSATIDRFGSLSGVVNATYANAGVAFDELTAADFDRTNRVNITGAFIFAREAAKLMNDGGSIVMFTSMYGIVSPKPDMYPEPMRPNPVEYGAGKGGMLQMVRYLAGHYGSAGVRVNAIAPGPFPNVAHKDLMSPVFLQNLADQTMLGRVGEQAESAGAVVFLLSDASTYVTGHCLSVDGGWTAW